MTVNTKHPHILHLLQTKLAQGMEAMKQGKQFAVEVTHCSITGLSNLIIRINHSYIAHYT